MSEEAEQVSIDEILNDIKAILEEDFDIEEAEEEEPSSEAAESAEAQAEGQPKAEGQPAEGQPQAKEQPKAEGQSAAGAQLDDAALSQLLERYYAERKAAEERQKEEAKRLEELNKLIQEGNYEELGKRVAQEWQARQAYQTVAQRVLQDYLLTLYRSILTDPLVQGLPEEVLDPARYNSDAEWVKALANALAQKQLEAAIEKEVEKRLQEKLKADAYAQAGDKLRSPTPAGTPGAGGPAPAWRNGFERLMVGLQEAYQRLNREREG